MNEIILKDSYRKYSLEWWFTECDEIWKLIEDKFQYNKQFKIKTYETNSSRMVSKPNSRKLGN
jgi:hypothetical protein